MAVEATSILALVGALLIILFSCEVFTNGIEWLGCRLGMSETSTGSEGTPCWVSSGSRTHQQAGFEGRQSYEVRRQD